MNWICKAVIATLFLFGAIGSATAGIDLKVETELQLLSRGETPPKRFGDAAFRVAVFSYEDPDGLGLGDTLAALVGHEMLAGSRVSSLGMLRYVGSLAPRGENDHGYFDKVELLMRTQEPTVALWGMVRREADQVIIDSYLQIPESTMARSLQVRLELPDAMGKGELRARLGADRLLLQRHRLPFAAVQELRDAAAPLNELRTQPRVNAPVRARLPLKTTYYVKELRGDWVLVGTYPGTVSGWVPRSGHCTGACAALIDAPRFVSDLLAFMEKRLPADPRDSLAVDAQQLRDQILAVLRLDAVPPDVEAVQPYVEDAIRLLDPWLPRPGNPVETAVAGGAGSANLRLLARVKGELWRARWKFEPGSSSRAYDSLQLPKEMLRQIAFEAADATLIDPQNVDLLNNLGVLFYLSGDSPRSVLAKTLLEKAVTSSRSRLLPSR